MIDILLGRFGTILAATGRARIGNDGSVKSQNLHFDTHFVCVQLLRHSHYRSYCKKLVRWVTYVSLGISVWYSGRMIFRHEHAGGVWVDLEQPTEDDVRRVANEFSIGERIVKEALSPTPSPLITPRASLPRTRRGRRGHEESGSRFYCRK